MNQNMQAIAWMLLTGFLTITIITLGRFLSEPPHAFHPFQIVFFYNACAVVFFLPLWLRNGITLKTSQRKLYTLRAMLEFISFSLTFYGVAHLALAVHTSISFIAPLIGSVFAIALLKEHNYFYRWLALSVGFCGVLIASQPWGAAFEPLPVLAMLGAAIGFGLCDICIKQLTKTEPSPRIAFYMVVLTAIIALPFAVWKWKQPTLEQLPWLILLGFMVAAVQLAVSKAFGKGDVTLVTPFFFFNIVWSSLYAYFLFGEYIDQDTLIGASIIITASLYAAHQARQKKAATF